MKTEPVIIEEQREGSQCGGLVKHARLAKSTDSLFLRKERTKAKRMPTIISKITNRLSKSTDDLSVGAESGTRVPRMISKVTGVLRTQGFRIKRRKEKTTDSIDIPLQYCDSVLNSGASDQDFGETNDDYNYFNFDFNKERGEHRELYGYKDIRTSHYEETSGRRTCRNDSCNAVFSFHVKPHHCRRCGGIFCSSCLQLRRKLNILAQPDPSGLPCKVCESCFKESRESDDIVTRPLTEKFSNMRSVARTEKHNIYCDMTVERKKTSIIPTFWREQFEIDTNKECRRLLEGFSAAINNSEKYVRKTVQELRKLVEVPAWQKSVFWALEKTVTSCRVCHSRFRKFHRQHKIRNCRVCGLALCKTCSNKELLVYFEDDEIQDINKRPKVSVIKFDGCPEAEPELSVLLYVCTDCKSAILKRQLEDPEWFEDRPKAIDVMSQLVKLHQEITSIQETIQDNENEVQRLTQEMERSLQAEAQNNVVSLVFKLHRHTLPLAADLLERMDNGLAKIDAGLSDFPGYINKLKDMLKCGVYSNKEATVLNNLIKAKCNFYLQHKKIFCDLSEKTGSL